MSSDKLGLVIIGVAVTIIFVAIVIAFLGAPFLLLGFKSVHVVVVAAVAGLLICGGVVAVIGCLFAAGNALFEFWINLRDDY